MDGIDKGAYGPFPARATPELSVHVAIAAAMVDKAPARYPTRDHCRQLHYPR
ncbi:hypothetical protein G5V57_17690 [Nordella sp. HKS 07]|uniref:hypothetical protein n=1 Tax=Nordella sp. HKS 07 TaxID=2712222 RepID=UPI0013E18E37|nr:hypothetical protein [Nordella sp. HKS 07]QIG49390.1 hypothetical protein G5V57_17690 [Nordella sp. HKS 07]